jgi:hypothetical protein
MYDSFIIGGSGAERVGGAGQIGGAKLVDGA